MQLGFTQFDLDRATQHHDTGGEYCDHGRHPLACEQCDDEERDRHAPDDDPYCRVVEFEDEYETSNDVEWEGAA